MDPMTRRAWLQHSGMASVALPMAWGSPALAIDPIPRSRPSHFKLSIAAYSYRRLLSGKSKSMDLFDFVDVAADLALDAVEPTTYYFPSDISPSYLHQLKRYAFLRGLDISGTAIGNNFCVAPGPKREQELNQARTWIQRAAELDAPVVRFFAGRVPNGETEATAIDRAIEGFQAVLPDAERNGVMLALENHGGITATPDQMMKLIRGIDHPYFGVNLDTGNFHTDDPYADLAQIAPYAINVQVKTEIRRRGKAEPADLAKIIDMLRDVQYSGYVVLEYEAEEDPMTAIPKYVDELRKLIG